MIMNKRITSLLIGAIVSLSIMSKAQTVIWTETWSGTSCAEGCQTYTGPNGAWTVVSTGKNGNDSNVWYFSEMETGMGRGQCGTGGGSPPTAHVGITTNSPVVWPIYQTFNSATYPDQGAIIDDDNNEPTRTNSMIESPVISCAFAQTITLSFNYIEGKSAGNDYATVWYYDGSAWSLLATPPENDSCSNGEGLWTNYSVTLPVSANYNPNVRIGFNWTNDTLDVDDSAFDNYFVPVVSFAVDSIVLTAATFTGISAMNDSKNAEVYPNPNNGKFTIEVKSEELRVKNIEIYNVLGEQVKSEELRVNNVDFEMSGQPDGLYLYRVINEDGSLVGSGKFVIER
jgi:hypothetical protein